jgi:hypothetical protein
VYISSNSGDRCFLSIFFLSVLEPIITADGKESRPVLSNVEELFSSTE